MKIPPTGSPETPSEGIAGADLNWTLHRTDVEVTLHDSSSDKVGSENSDTAHARFLSS